jgi:transcriptional regulator with XRE-family HTH domain
MVYESRVEAGLTQKELADRAHTTQPVIARLESGRNSRIPSVDLLNRIAFASNRRLVLRFL